MKRAFILMFLLANLTLKAQNYTDKEKLLLGKWEYNIAFDTIAEVDTTEFYKPHGEREEILFFTDFDIKKSKAKLSDPFEKINATWEIKNGDELYFFLENNKILKYFITKLTADTLELRKPGSKISTLGYYKK